jgi:hypothetical protein
MYQSNAEYQILKVNTCTPNLSKSAKVRNVSEEEKINFKEELLQIQASLLDSDARKGIITQPGIVTGFSDELIDSLVRDIEHIGSLHILVQYFPFFNTAHAEAVYECIQKLFAQNYIQDTDDEILCDILSSEDSDSGASDNSDDPIDNFDNYTVPIIRYDESSSDE